jgi:hypothetical protein
MDSRRSCCWHCCCCCCCTAGHGMHLQHPRGSTTQAATRVGASMCCCHSHSFQYAAPPEAPGGTSAAAAGGGAIGTAAALLGPASPACPRSAAATTAAGATGYGRHTQFHEHGMVAPQQYTLSSSRTGSQAAALIRYTQAHLQLFTEARCCHPTLGGPAPNRAVVNNSQPELRSPAAAGWAAAPAVAASAWTALFMAIMRST